MTFLYPAALAGLLVAATPVVIYLFLRRRKTEINWGAGYLLRLTLASRKKSSLWRQFVVLALRSIILALAGLLIAQPFLPGAHPSLDTPALPDSPVHRVILFDNSRSMTATEDKVTRIDRARSAASSLLQSQRSGDTLDIIPLIPEAGRSLEPIELEGIVDDNHIQHAVAAIPVRDGEIPLEPALACAMTRLATTPDSASEIYIFSDFPRELESQIDQVSWFSRLVEDGVQPGAATTQGTVAVSIAMPSRIRVAPVSMIGPVADDAQQNVSIDAVTLGTDLLIAGIPTRLYIDASNHTDRETLATFEVSTTVPLRQAQIRLNPDEHKRIAIPLVLPAGTGQVISVTVTPSRLAAQGTRHLSVDVKDALDVWLVADEKDPSAASAEPDDTEFFQRAIKQRKDSGPGIRLKQAKMNDLTLPIPPDVDAIILAAPHYTTPAIDKPLTDFVQRGGGLLLTVSAATAMPAYSENLAPLLPGQLDQPMHETIDPESFLQAQVELGAPVPDPGSGAVPDSKAPASNALLRPLFEELGSQSTTAVASDLGQARFYNHYRFKEPQSVAGVVLRLSNADPLLVDKRIGRGHSFFFGSTLGIGWTSLPVRQSYIPLITRTLTASVAGRLLPLNIGPPQSFVTPWPGKSAPTLTFPDQSTRPAPLLDAFSGRFVVLDALTVPGVYQLADAEGHKRFFTIGGGAAEADLRPLAAPAKARLAKTLGSEIYPDWTAAVTALGPRGQTMPVWPWLLAGMLALYLFESWFVRTL